MGGQNGSAKSWVTSKSSKVEAPELGAVRLPRNTWAARLMMVSKCDSVRFAKDGVYTLIAGIRFMFSIITSNLSSTCNPGRTDLVPLSHTTGRNPRVSLAGWASGSAAL
jgi:hypothetical protein